MIKEWLQFHFRISSWLERNCSCTKSLAAVLQAQIATCIFLVFNLRGCIYPHPLAAHQVLPGDGPAAAVCWTVRDEPLSALEPYLPLAQTIALLLGALLVSSDILHNATKQQPRWWRKNALIIHWSSQKLFQVTHIYTAQKSHYSPGNHHASHF